MTNAGKRLYNISSTATNGKKLSPENSQLRFLQDTLNSSGLSLFGNNLKTPWIFAGLSSWIEDLPNWVPHHGQSSIGIGLFLVPSNFKTLDLAVYWSLSPFLPILLGVPLWPTHNPISKGHSPKVTGSFFLSISRAQINVAERPNWSRVNRRNVYLIKTLIPADDISPLCLSLLKTRVNAANPRYASVFPPPVGKNNNSIISLSGLIGSFVPTRFISKKASWNGLHFAVISLGSFPCIFPNRCWAALAITLFVMAKARRTFSSPRRFIPSWILNECFLASSKSFIFVSFWMLFKSEIFICSSIQLS